MTELCYKISFLSVKSYTENISCLHNIGLGFFIRWFFYYVAGRVRLLLSKGHSCYRPRRDGERKRKSVRGCIVDANLSVLALVIIKKGEQVNNHKKYILCL